MKRFLLVVLMATLSQGLYAALTKQVFISFSMPEALISEVLAGAEQHNVTVILNGLIKDNMRETFKTIFKLAKKYPNVGVQIDPTAFEKYHIDAVPAFVVDDGETFDVIYGNLSVGYALDFIRERGETQGVLS